MSAEILTPPAAVPTVPAPVADGSRVWRAFDLAVDVLVGAALVIPAVLVLANIVTRLVTGYSILWVDEVSTIGLNVLAYVGGALAYQRGHHVAVRLLVDKLPERWHAAQRCVVHWVVILMSAGLAYYASELVHNDWSDKTNVLRISASWAQLPLALGALLLIAYGLRQLAGEPRRTAIVSGIVMIALCALLSGTLPLWDDLLVGRVLAFVLVIFVALIAIGVPVGFVLGTSALLYVYINAGNTLIAIPLAMLAGSGQYVLLAIPFFVFAGLIMDRGGVSSRLIDFVASGLRRFPGGLLQVMVASMYLFSGISGSKGADIAAVGSVMSGKLRRAGYDPGESVAVLVASAAMGETVPPSIAMILLGSVTTLSVGALFVAGVLPALAVALGLMLTIWIRARRGLLGDLVPPPPSPGVLRSARGAFLPLLMPVILFAGILGGIATPTEVSTVAVLYGLVLALWVYRELDLRGLGEVIRYSTMMTGMVLFLIGTAAGFTYAVTVERIPHRIADAMAGLPGGIPVFMLITIVVLVVMGAILEGLPALLIFGPILLPVATELGIDPLHYGIVMIMSMGVGAFAPPLGVGLYIACSVCDTKLEVAMRRMFWYEVTLVVGLLVLAFVPAVSLALPHLLNVSTS